jgi:taurine dioxygenase
MTAVETLILASYFFVLLILAVYGWHRYYLVYIYMKHKHEQPRPKAAFDELPEDQRRKLTKLRSAHVYESSQSPRKMAALSPEERAKIPQTVQPLVIRHPENGRAALYLNTGRMEGIDGMPPDEAFALIDELYRHATQPRYEYRHKWRAGDMVIWDNRSVMHQANADYDPSEYRYLYRIMLKGAPLQPASA